MYIVVIQTKNLSRGSVQCSSDGSGQCSSDVMSSMLHPSKSRSSIYPSCNVSTNNLTPSGVDIFIISNVEFGEIPSVLQEWYHVLGAI